MLKSQRLASRLLEELALEACLEQESNILSDCCLERSQQYGDRKRRKSYEIQSAHAWPWGDAALRQYGLATIKDDWDAHMQSCAER